MKISKHQLKRIIREEKDKALDEIDLENLDGANGDHHWPRVDWDNVGVLVDKWHDMEMKSWDPDGPVMFPDGEEMSQTDAKDFWREQVDAASYDLENEMTVEIRKVALAAMRQISEKLMMGEYA